MTTAPRAALGSHLPVAGGLACALDTAERIGAESVHVFVSNPRGWATPNPDPVPTGPSPPGRRTRAGRCSSTPPTPSTWAPVYGAAQLLQTAGLGHTAASVSGFITGMYVVFTPLLAAVIFRQRVGRTAWIAVVVATVGLGALSLQGFAGLGETLTLASAALFGLHIVGLGAWSTTKDAFGLSVLQMVVIAAVWGLGALPGGVVLPQTATGWRWSTWRSSPVRSPSSRRPGPRPTSRPPAPLWS